MRDAKPASWFEPEAGTRFDAGEWVGGCLERGVSGILAAAGALPPAFFELGTGVAGELVQKLANYRIRMAVVVPDLAERPLRFREFAAEANRGRQLRFVASREEALAWLNA